jgi:DNA-binding transcriptional regulator LsrR (DeoR family)
LLVLGSSSRLRAQGACTKLLNADGQPVTTDFTDRFITTTATQLRTVAEVVAVGGGHDKGRAVPGGPAGLAAPPA